MLGVVSAAGMGDYGVPYGHPIAGWGEVRLFAVAGGDEFARVEVVFTWPDGDDDPVPLALTGFMPSLIGVAGVSLPLVSPGLVSLARWAARISLDYWHGADMVVPLESSS